MSQSNVSVQKIDYVVPHPSADRLDIVRVAGYCTVAQRDEFKTGECCIYFPPDNLLPANVAKELGVEDYLKTALYPGESEERKCRVGAARIRGVSSFGFAIPTAITNVGVDLNEQFGVVRYNPPPKLYVGNAIAPHPLFVVYNDIENVQRFPDTIPIGEQVIYTEKLNGSNCRIGCIDGVFMAGSHNVQVSPECKDSLYWTPMEVCGDLLRDVQRDNMVDMIIFGELFGPGVRSMHYDLKRPEFRAFDVMVNGEYVDALIARKLCEVYGIPLVPMLGTGPFNLEMLSSLTDGPSKLANHIREGVVVKSCKESIPRKILKSVSVDYLAK